MKKIMIVVIVVLCTVLFVSAAFAWEFKPALSVGYAFDATTPHYTFSNRGIVLLGITKADLKAPRFSGLYIAGELPFAITDRLKVTLEGSWALSLSNQDMDEVYNYGIASRSWDVDTNNNAVTADVLVSYAFIKDLSFIKDVSAAAGFRWDYHTMSYDEPIAVGPILSGPADTLDLTTHTLAPVFGITSTFKGFKSGMFGGDMKLGVLAGPVVWGNVNYKETGNNGASSLRSDDNLGSNGYLLKVFGEITALSGKITPGMNASLSVFAQYTRFETGGTVDMESSGGVVGSYDFDTASDGVVVGLKGAIEF
jgi:hypothetical protein